MQKGQQSIRKIDNMCDAGFGIPHSRRRVFILASYHGDARDVLLTQVSGSVFHEISKRFYCFPKSIVVNDSRVTRLNLAAHAEIIEEQELLLVAKCAKFSKPSTKWSLV